VHHLYLCFFRLQLQLQYLVVASAVVQVCSLFSPS